MKLMRVGSVGKERPAILTGEHIYDVSDFGEDYNERFFDSDGIARLQAWVGKQKQLPEVSSDERVGTPFARPSKIICIGLNYTDHALEINSKPPAEPILFFKSTSALAGPNDDVHIPRDSTKLDWEVELAIIIGKHAKYVREEDSAGYIAGYCLHNDYSERAFQLERGGQWVKGKSCDTFAPMGPWLCTPDEIEDVQYLPLWLTVNGHEMQRGNTSNMIFDVNHLVSYVSQFMSLLPGDVISTGTPAGVGLGKKPPVYLNAGDVVELGIEGLGVQRQVVVDPR